MIGRIWYFLKTSFNSCLASKKRTAIFIALILFFAIIIGLDNVPYSWGIAAIGYVLYVSYGMQFAGELISDREFLPKFDFKAIPIGIKALIVLWVYGALQALILWGISTLFNFPSFEFEKFFLEFSETVLSGKSVSYEAGPMSAAEHITPAKGYEYCIGRKCQ